MNFLKSLSFDFREIVLVDEGLYKQPLIPSVLWLALEKSSIHLWGAILKRYRVEFEYTYTTDDAHTCLGEFDEERHISKIHALVSTTLDTPHNLIFQVIQTVMHEYIHASQSYHDSDHFNNVAECKTMIDYLSEWREIQALAHCAFLELMEYTDRPTRTVDYYTDMPQNIKRKFYRQIARWAKKYDVTFKLTK